MNKVLLISSCIQPDLEVRYNRLKSPKVRLTQYRKCLNNIILDIINYKCFDRILYIDNSGYDIFKALDDLVIYANMKNIPIELISLPRLKYINKGIGESQIMNEAIKHINDDDLVFKITGRLQYPDIRECIETIELCGLDNYFIYDPDHKTVKLKTYVFAMVGKDFKTVFDNLVIKDVVNLTREMNFEYKVEERLKLNNINYLNLPKLTVIGNYASSGKPYQQ